MPRETAAQKKAREAKEAAEAAAASAVDDAKTVADDAAEDSWAPKGAAAKLAWIQTHVADVEKTGTHAQGYSYMQEHGLLNVLRPLLRQMRCAIVISPAEDGYYLADNAESASVRGTLTFIDSEAPQFIDRGDGTFAENRDRVITATYANEGHFNNAKSALGKGLNKAQTGFAKYALQKFFAVPTEHIDDNDAAEVADVQREVQQARSAPAEAQNGTSSVATPAAASDALVPAERADAMVTWVASEVEAGHLDGNRFKAKLGTFSADHPRELTVAQFEDLGTWAQEQVAKAAAPAAS